MLNSTLINKIRNSFTAKFKEEPIIILSPGRINLIGEHIDYNNGFVFPAAIDKGIAMALQKSDENSTAVAFDFEEFYHFDIDDIDTIDNGGWRNYLIGVIKELQAIGKKPGQFNAIFGGNVPAGAGLSSSAALENAIVYGLNELFELGLTKKEMIFISQRAEHNYAGVKCGIMDQFASMFGEENQFLLLDCRDVTYQAYPIELKDYELVLVNTNVQHNLSESTYNKRRELCERAAAHFGVSSLRDLSKEVLYEGKDNFSDEEFNMIKYVVEEIERTKKAAEAIKNEDVLALGELLFETHNGLSKQYKVSCTELDFLVYLAKESKHAIGARMMGGGFGGCTINLVKKKGLPKFIQKVSASYLQRFGHDCTPMHIKLSKGTHRVY